MMDTMVNTPTPVRQLVAQFDNLHVDVMNKNCDEDSNHDKSLDSGAGGSLDDQLSAAGGSQLIEECSTLPTPATLRSSIPLSGQTLDKVLSQPTPEPVLAHAVHSGLRESTVSHCHPNEKNLAEVVVSELEVSGSDVAKKVNSEDSTKILSGEHFRKLLNISRSDLEKRIEMAAEVLGNAKDIPEAAADTVRLAVGKANLLLSRKMKKFAELIDKNLNPVDGDLQPAKVCDLTAYWDLVKIELLDVERLFNDIDLLRQNNWQPVPVSAGDDDSKGSQSKVDEKTVRKVRPAPAARTKDAGKNAATERQRKQALAEAKRRLRERMQNDGADSDTLIS
ncbi:unnamed protein product [Enterobius vermicularis]|uniref:BZIP domain-containing protein n=1 Tax=Enterobius vermicularis TaxID=51028 RepID=A0A0N4VLV2_ENTVE|nr:unnamed protein product [Enterobius vermicularis]